jgi:hypothetical protein
MTPNQVTQGIIGTKCSFNFTGLKSTGTIKKIIEDENCVSVEVEFDRPIAWGEHRYEKNSFFMRKSDGWGSAMNIELLN